MTPHMLAHSHSALVFRMDELEAYARGLAEATEDLAPLLEGLHDSFALFVEDLMAHIQHEEQDIFPEAAASGLVPAPQVELLRNEHMGLHRCLDRIGAQLKTLDPTSPVHQRERLVRDIAVLRNAFVRHAGDERCALGAADQASCQSS
jgi:iron-sulfur cluster repair protein YtfE (RIC family)